MDEIWATFTIAFLLLITPFLSMHRKYPSSKDGVSNSMNFSMICDAGLLPCAVKELPEVSSLHRSYLAVRGGLEAAKPDVGLHLVV